MSVTDNSPPLFPDIHHTSDNNDSSFSTAIPVVSSDNNSTSFAQSQSQDIVPIHISTSRPVRTKQLPAKFKDFTGLPSGNAVTTNLVSTSSTSGMNFAVPTVYPIQNHITYQNFTPTYRAYLAATTQIPTPYNFQQASKSP